MAGEAGDDRVRLQVAVAERGFHSEQLRCVSGLDVGEGQARILLNDIRAYCDLLEVRWLSSEEAGRDIGDGPALEALRRRAVPAESAAEVAVAELTTGEVPIVAPADPGEPGGPP